MKKLFLLVFIVSVVGVATAEVIDSVSFNPSRLGRYQHLKVSDKLDAGSVLTSQFVTVNASRQTTMNYGGTLPVTVTNAEVATLDMDDDTTLFTPSVHLIGGDTTVTGTTNVGTNVKDDSNAASVYATQLNLPNHTVNVHGGGRLWDGENHISDKSFVLGGNNIPSPATSDCKSLGWFTRRDEKTGADFKVLGCTPHKENLTCKVTNGTASVRTYKNQVPTDDCDGQDALWYSGGCKDHLLSSGSCTDLYFIGCSGPTMVGNFNEQTNGETAFANIGDGSCYSTDQTSSMSYAVKNLNNKFWNDFAKNNLYGKLPKDACDFLFNYKNHEHSYRQYMTEVGDNQWHFSDTFWYCASQGQFNCYSGYKCVSTKLTCDLDTNVERKYNQRTITFKME